MNEEIKEGLKLISKGTKQVTKAALLKFKEGVDNFVDTVTDDKFEEKMKAETKAMAYRVSDVRITVTLSGTVTGSSTRRAQAPSSAAFAAKVWPSTTAPRMQMKRQPS